MPRFLLRSWNCILCKQGSPKGDHCCIWGIIKEPRYFVRYSICSQNHRTVEVEKVPLGVIWSTWLSSSLSLLTAQHLPTWNPATLILKKKLRTQRSLSPKPPTILTDWRMAWAYLFHAVTTPDGRISTQEIPHMTLQKWLGQVFL